jgi:hypothetical protein
MKRRNRHVTHESRANGPKVVETDARSPMLPMYSAAELAVRDPRRLSCVYEAACVDVVAKTSPNALAAECPEGCALQRKPDPNVRADRINRAKHRALIEAKKAARCSS